MKQRTPEERRAYLLDKLPRAFGTALVLMPKLSDDDMSTLLGILAAVNGKHSTEEPGCDHCGAVDNCNCAELERQSEAENDLQMNQEYLRSIL